MNVNEEINKIKAKMTKDDIARFKRDVALKRIIDDTFDDEEGLYKFLMLYNIQFIRASNIDIDDFFNDLRRSNDIFIKAMEYASKGH